MRSSIFPNRIFEERKRKTKRNAPAGAKSVQVRSFLFIFSREDMRYLLKIVLWNDVGVKRFFDLLTLVSWNYFTASKA